MKRVKGAGVLNNLIEKKWLSLVVFSMFLMVLPLGANAATGGPDLFGYRYVDSKSGEIDFFYEDIEETGIDYKGFDKPEIDFPNLLGLPISIGFNFKFYGREYRYLYLAGNGYVQFAPDANFRNYVYDGSGLPSTNDPNNLIAPLWGWHDTFS